MMRSISDLAAPAFDAESPRGDSADLEEWVIVDHDLGTSSSGVSRSESKRASARGSSELGGLGANLRDTLGVLSAALAPLDRLWSTGEAHSQAAPARPSDVAAAAAEQTESADEADGRAAVDAVREAPAPTPEATTTAPIIEPTPTPAGMPKESPVSPIVAAVVERPLAVTEQEPVANVEAATTQAETDAAPVNPCDQEPLLDAIRALKTSHPGLTAKQIFDRLSDEHDVTISAVKRCCSRIHRELSSTGCADKRARNSMGGAPIMVH